MFKRVETGKRFVTINLDNELHVDVYQIDPNNVQVDYSGPGVAGREIVSGTGFVVGKVAMLDTSGNRGKLTMSIPTGRSFIAYERAEYGDVLTIHGRFNSKRVLIA